MKILLIFFFILLSHMAIAQTDVCTRFNVLNSNIRDCTIDKTTARSEFRQLLPLVKAEYYRHTGKQQKRSWTFPLRGYNSRAIGGQNGNGYIAKGYSFWDGNAHGGHPAHDIFIQDKNQDCIDDNTQKPVEVVSCTNGIVVAAETNWLAGSPQRGGNYIMIYSPDEQRLFYYAHNGALAVSVGTIVNAGQKIAEVGRSGANAARKRSPTHLHFMVLRLSDGLPVAEDSWMQLKGAKSE